MHRPSIALAVLLPGLLLPSARLLGAEAPEAQLKAVFEERYGAMKSALAARDPKALAALLAPGFESVDVEGKTETADQMVGQVGALPQDPHRASDTTLLSVERQGDTAVVTQRYHMTTTKPRPAGGSPQAIEMTATSTDTWRLANGTWLLERTVTDSLDYKVDGRLVLHKQRAPSS